jgi:cysteine desulfurase/selenocysteine lyase
MTELFEASYDTFAQWLDAPSRRSIATYRNTTEAINAVMYSLLTDFRDGDNVVTTMMEHNSNFVPWYGMCREILPSFGRHVECRVARFDHRTGELDLEHLARLVDDRTKLVCVTGASNFLGTKPPLLRIRALADGSGYRRDDGSSGSLLLVDAAQLVPTTYVDVRRLDVDYLAFSCHKMLAPFGVGVLYAKEPLLAQARPFLYGGDMIATGRVAPDRVEYNDLPWKYAAGTPNILGVIVSAQALRLLVDLVGVDESTRWFGSTAPLPPSLIALTMDRVGRHTAELTEVAMCEAMAVDGLRWYGPTAGLPRSPLLAFNVAGVDPFALAEDLGREGVEARAGCHCATLAHRDLGMDPPASCRLSFALYNSRLDVTHAMDAVRRVTDRLRRAGSGRVPPQVASDRRAVT